MPGLDCRRRQCAAPSELNLTANWAEMRIVCPGCSAAYEVPADLVAGRPLVRCVQCDEEWHPEPSDMPPTLIHPGLIHPRLTHDNADEWLAPVPGATTAVAERARPAIGSLQRKAPAPTGAPSGAPSGAPLGTTPTPAAAAPQAASVPEPALAEVGAAVAPEHSAPVIDDPSPAIRVARQLSAADLVEATPRHRRVVAAVVRNLAPVAGWAFSLGILLALGWMVIEHRSRIMQAWPPSERLFGWLGLA